MRKQGYGWPIVQLNVKYIQPALFRQRIRIDLAVVEYESCLRINYVIFDESGKKLTTASTTQVAVSIATRETQWQTPECWRQAVENHPSFTKDNDK